MVSASELTPEFDKLAEFKPKLVEQSAKFEAEISSDLFWGHATVLLWIALRRFDLVAQLRAYQFLKPTEKDYSVMYTNMPDPLPCIPFESDVAKWVRWSLGKPLKIISDDDVRVWTAKPDELLDLAVVKDVLTSLPAISNPRHGDKGPYFVRDDVVRGFPLESAVTLSYSSHDFPGTSKLARVARELIKIGDFEGLGNEVLLRQVNDSVKGATFSHSTIDRAKALIRSKRTTKEIN